MGTRGSDMAERRERVAFIGYDELAILFRGVRGGNILAYAVSDMPEGVSVVRVAPDDSRGGVYVYFAHPSFDPVHGGCKPPSADVRVRGLEMPVSHPNPGEAKDIVERFGDHAVWLYSQGQLSPETLAAAGVG